MRRPCPCRGWIDAVTEHPSDIADAVAEHIETDLHQAWRDDGGMDRYTSFEVRVVTPAQTIAAAFAGQAVVSPVPAAWGRVKVPTSPLSRE